jgi:hypothetical protein
MSDGEDHSGPDRGRSKLRVAMIVYIRVRVFNSYTLLLLPDAFAHVTEPSGGLVEGFTCWRDKIKTNSTKYSTHAIVLEM